LRYFFVISDYKSIQNAIVSVSRSYGWANPSYLQELYCDRKDYLGLFFWSDDVVKQNEEIKKQTKGKK